MKFIAKGLDHTPQIWLLSNDMVSAIEDSGIGLDNLHHLPKFSKLIAASDIIAIAVMNYGVSLKLNSPNTMVFSDSSYEGVAGEVLRTKIEAAISSFPKLSLLQAFNAADQFYVKKTQSGFIICQGSKKPAGPTWLDVEESYFGNALLKCIYEQIGFYQLHFKDVTRPLPGEFSLASVLGILA